MSKELKPLPSIRNDAEAEKFVDTADLTEFDLSGFKPMRFEIAKKESALNLRIPAALLDAVKVKAKSQGIPCARYVRMVLEADVAAGRKA